MDERDLKIENLSKKDLIEILQTIVAAFPLPIDRPVIAVLMFNTKVELFNCGLAILKRLESQHRRTRRRNEKRALAKRHDDLGARLCRMEEDLGWLKAYIDKNDKTKPIRRKPCSNS